MYITWPRLNLTFIRGFVLSTTDKTGFAHGRKPRAPNAILKLFGLSLYCFVFQTYSTPIKSSLSVSGSGVGFCADVLSPGKLLAKTYHLLSDSLPPQHLVLIQLPINTTYCGLGVFPCFLNPKFVFTFSCDCAKVQICNIAFLHFEEIL